MVPGSIPCDLSRKDFYSGYVMGKPNGEPICYLLQWKPEFLLTEQMDLSCVRGGQRYSHFLRAHQCSPSLDCCLKSSKTVQMFPLPQSPAEFTLISYELRPRESVTFPVTLGCLQPIGWQQIYFYLSGPIVWRCDSAHCLVTVTNMLIREAQMMDGSSPESGLSF